LDKPLFIFKNTRFLLLDVDGIMTDGKITYTNSGDELKSFSVYDGLGIKLLAEAGIGTGVVTARESEIVKKRCAELSISPVFQNIKDKSSVINIIEKDFNIKKENICFMGDDLIDLPLLKLCGIPVTVPNACPEAKSLAKYLTENSGGSGAVREVCELILKSQNMWEMAVEKFSSPGVL
jgi:3-deoxy-D-manno-octulosonate 8-phosphate phosphatase (KDO 8-P phosphatase)